MYTISLTSIPPRFDRLGPVLSHLLAQDPAPDRVILALPREFRRFPGAVVPPALPRGVDIIWSDRDYGPATKAIVAARALAGSGSGSKLIYCDDDWLYPAGWAAALMSAPDHATTGQTWGIERLRRRGTGHDIAQGFAGVCVSPRWLSGPELTPPDAAWAADDIWLSGHLARQRITLHEVPSARHGMRPAYPDTHALQTAQLNGQTRDAANRACAALLHDRYGIWPDRA